MYFCKQTKEKMKLVTAQEAVSHIQSNSRIYVQCAAATPSVLMHSIVARAHDLRNVEMCHLHTFGEAPYTDIQYKDSFFTNSFYIGANARKTITQGNGSYTPTFLSELPLLFDHNILPLDVVFIHVTPPNKEGYCSLGTSVEATRAAIRNAKLVIAQINTNMPFTFGDALVHVDEITFGIEINAPIFESPIDAISDIELRIGAHVASLIDDKSCLQMGIGSIPNAVLSNLTNHKDLGVFTEMFSDGVVDLVEKNVITSKYNTINPNKITSTFVQGTKRLFDFIDHNDFVIMKEASFTNNEVNIRQNDRMVSINSAIEIDVTGQVCADSFGSKLYSGVGGQIDYVRGAVHSKNGKAIIAMPAVTAKGINKIVPAPKTGAGVVTTRANIQYVVTEYGIAQLYGKNIKDRVKAMIDIAHPDFREQIAKDYFELTR